MTGSTDTTDTCIRTALRPSLVYDTRVWRKGDGNDGLDISSGRVRYTSPRWDGDTRGPCGSTAHLGVEQEAAAQDLGVSDGLIRKSIVD